MPTTTEFLLPVLALVAWTLMMWFWMYATRIPAMQKAKIRWDAKSLDGFLAKPSAAVPGSRMVFAGLPNPADRANLLAYLAGATKK